MNSGLLPQQAPSASAPASNIGFANAAKGDFRLKQSAAAAIGFAPIPFDEIGLYRDDLRKHVP